ncbi:MULTISPECIES: tyrosine-protein phosphatase [Desertihabitans]|uniref:Protein-tyrosine-phosphatase n=1 Tax=Desertihabitans brevis TaxID=2268447 RepID=A0A367YSG1_9ACTN|nr:MULTISPECIES: tyrosine-protein phosphatase [Desertihabitans]RCK68758.1 protein-tyrosine-phosphatase [Desertihabitans brevis]
MPNWIELDGLVNARDLGGTPVAGGGEVLPGRLLRSDNLQDLTPADIEELRRRGLTDVIDLRSAYEVNATGDGPLRALEEIRHHHFSFFVEEHGEATSPATGDELPENALPWVEKQIEEHLDDHFASTYWGYLSDRPDSVVGALRAIAHADGAALVHCAAGKDRTGTTVALALSLVGAERDAVVADYAASDERVPLIMERLMGSPVYAANLRGRSHAAQATKAETMDAFLRYVEESHGGVAAMLGRLGWTERDTDAMRRHLLG